jgi:hypothetical protein
MARVVPLSRRSRFRKSPPIPCHPEPDGNRRCDEKAKLALPVAWVKFAGGNVPREDREQPAP